MIPETYLLEKYLETIIKDKVTNRQEEIDAYQLIIHIATKRKNILDSFIGKNEWKQIGDKK